MFKRQELICPAAKNVQKDDGMTFGDDMATSAKLARSDISRVVEESDAKTEQQLSAIIRVKKPSFLMHDAGGHVEMSLFPPCAAPAVISAWSMRCWRTCLMPIMWLRLRLLLRRSGS